MVVNMFTLILKRILVYKDEYSMNHICIEMQRSFRYSQEHLKIYTSTAVSIKEEGVTFYRQRNDVKNNQWEQA